MQMSGKIISGRGSIKCKVFVAEKSLACFKSIKRSLNIYAVVFGDKVY